MTGKKRPACCATGGTDQSSVEAAGVEKESSEHPSQAADTDTAPPESALMQWRRERAAAKRAAEVSL